MLFQVKECRPPKFPPAAGCSSLLLASADEIAEPSELSYPAGTSLGTYAQPPYPPHGAVDNVDLLGIDVEEAPPAVSKDTLI